MFAPFRRLPNGLLTPGVASFNEKLLLSNGLTISPLKGQPGEARSLRECIAAIDNDRDLNEFVSAYHNQLPRRTVEPKYERNPVLDAQQRAPISPTGPPGPGSSFQSMSQPMSQPPSMGRAGPGNYAESPTTPQGPPGHGYHGSVSMVPGAQRPGSQPQPERHERSFSIGSLTSRHNNNPPPSQQFQPRNSLGPQQPAPSSRFNGGPNSFGSSQGSGGPPQLGALPFQPSAQPPPHQPAQQPPPPAVQQQPPPQFQQQQQQQPPHLPPLAVQNNNPLQQNPLQQNPPQQNPNQQGPGMPRLGYAPAPARQQTPPQPGPPTRPVFRVTLSELYERDQLAVPMVVYQCIQAVDLYGLGVEGIYRLSGSLPHVNKLKAMFDQGKASPLALHIPVPIIVLTTKLIILPQTPAPPASTSGTRRTSSTT